MTSNGTGSEISSRRRRSLVAAVALLLGATTMAALPLMPGDTTRASNPVPLPNPLSSGSIIANPNPIQVCDGTGLGITTISWNTSGATKVEVHVGSPTGTLFGSGLSGKTTTTKSITDGTVFYLQDLSGKTPVTITSVTVSVTGCATPTATATQTPTPPPPPPSPPPSPPSSPSPPPSPPPVPQISGNQIGRLTSSGNGQRRTAYEYDALGRTTRSVHNFEGQSKAFTTTYGYSQSPNLAGLGNVPVSQTFPDNERVDYTYDAGGTQQSTVTTPSGQSSQPIINHVYRNSRGQTIAAAYGNGAISIYKYNEMSDLRLGEIHTAVGASLVITGSVPQLNGGTPLQDYTYTFDNNGNVKGIADGRMASLSATYDYDSLDQLIKMTPAAQSALPYSYDRLGNLNNKENVVQTYGGSQSCAGCPTSRGPHALATSGNGAVTYNYDSNGNLITTSTGTTITWNGENMPTKVTQNGATVYKKFFVGESLWKKVEPGITTFYLPAMRIENGQVRKFFSGFAERSPDGSLKFYHNDHLGSASLVTNQSGVFIRRQAYMPFGEDRFVSGSFLDARYQFNFKEKEVATGFYDYGARLYNPITGRFVSADTNLKNGLNRYSYVGNNPLRYIDPTGHAGDQPTALVPEEVKKWILDKIDKDLLKKIGKTLEEAVKGRLAKMGVKPWAAGVIASAIIDYLKDPDKVPFLGWKIPGAVTGGPAADWTGRWARIVTLEDLASGRLSKDSSPFVNVISQESFIYLEGEVLTSRFPHAQALMTRLDLVEKQDERAILDAIHKGQPLVIITFDPPKWTGPPVVGDPSRPVVPNVRISDLQNPQMYFVGPSPTVP